MPQPHLKKSLGQNFLIDASVPRCIAESVRCRQILEIGAGDGALTAELAQISDKLLSVEIDRTLSPLLSEKFRNCANVTLLNADVMKLDLSAVISEHFDISQPIAVCANLPYYITTPIISKLIECERFASLTLMVQLEVAERMAAMPNTAEYGAFSVFVQYHTQPQILFTVPPTAFVPQPKVTSAVVECIVKKTLPTEHEKMLFRTVKYAFAQRRKTLANALSNGFGCERSVITNALQKLGHRADIRGETLSVAEFIELSEMLYREAV